MYQPAHLLLLSAEAQPGGGGGGAGFVPAWKALHQQRHSPPLVLL